MSEDTYRSAQEAGDVASDLSRWLDRLAEAVRRGEKPSEMLVDHIRGARLQLSALIGRALKDEAMEMEAVRTLATRRDA